MRRTVIGRDPHDPRGPQRVGRVPMRPVGGPPGGTGVVTDPPPVPPRPPEPTVSLDVWRSRLAAARRRQIKTLRLYARRGRFPTYHTPDRVQHILHRELTDREPVFVDQYGVHCAVGFLMSAAGWGSAVRDIARTNNNVYVEEVESGALVRWIETSGLTQQEAALIQPSYDWREPPRRPVPKPPPDDDRIKPAPPPPPRPVIAQERARLIEHFNEVDKQLREDNDISVDEALYRLKPRIEKGLPISAVGGRDIG